jgi:hypothetical protein
MRGTKLIAFLNECYPEYKGMLYFGLTELSRIYMKGNMTKMKAFLCKHCIPHYLGKDGHKMYCILEVQEAVESTRWERSAS